MNTSSLHNLKIKVLGKQDNPNKLPWSPWLCEIISGEMKDHKPGDKITFSQRTLQIHGLIKYNKETRKWEY